MYLRKIRYKDESYEDTICKTKVVNRLLKFKEEIWIKQITKRKEKKCTSTLILPKSSVSNVFFPTEWTGTLL